MMPCFKRSVKLSSFQSLVASTTHIAWHVSSAARTETKVNLIYHIARFPNDLELYKYTNTQKIDASNYQSV